MTHGSGNGDGDGNRAGESHRAGGGSRGHGDRGERDGGVEAEGERDAWLQEALRHAPDHSVVPPLALSDAILRAARSSADSAPSTAPSFTSASSFSPSAALPTTASSQPSAPPRGAAASGLLAWWSWLARPPVAAGFASVLAATLVGMLWWDRPLDERLPGPPASAAAPADSIAHGKATPPPLVAAAPQPSPSPSPDALRLPAPPPLPSPSPDANPRLTLKARVQERAAPDLASGPATRQSDAPPSTAPPSTASPSAAPLPEMTGAMAAPRAFPESPASATDAGPERRRQTAALEAARTGRSGRAAVVDADSEPASRSESSAKDREPDAGSNGVAQVPGRRDSSLAASATAPVGLDSLRREIEAQPGRWSWQRDAATPVPVDAPLRRWLAATGDAATSRSSDAGSADTRSAAAKPGATPSPSPSPSPSTSPLPSPSSSPLSPLPSPSPSTLPSLPPSAPHVLRFWRDGRLHTTVRLEADRLAGEPAAEPGRRWQVLLEPGAGARLARDLPVPAAAR